MSIELPDDLIFEIISYLPLKFVVQCKSLSKNFNLQISHPYFQNIHTLRSKTNDCLLYYTTLEPSPILSKLELQSYHHHSSLSSKSNFSSFSIFESFAVLSSSGGLLLLQFYRRIQVGDEGKDTIGNRLCVFNPITGAYRIIPSVLNLPSLLNFKDNDYNSYGFTCQLTDTNNFKLVAVSLKLLKYTFFIFQLNTNNWCTSEKELILPNINRSSEFLTAFQAVYYDDSFYWLRQDGHILVFNTKTEVSRLISRYEEFKLRDFKPYNTCFNIIQNKISVVIAEDYKIFFYLYDFINCSWKLDQVLDKSSCIINDPFKVYPLFYDGKRLISKEITSLITGKIKDELYLDDFTTNLCREIPTFPFWCSSIQTFRYFAKSLAQIPDCNYLSKQQILGREYKKTVISILCFLHKFISCVELSM